MMGDKVEHLGKTSELVLYFGACELRINAEGTLNAPLAGNIFPALVPVKLH